MTPSIAVAINLAPQTRAVLLHLERRGSISPKEAERNLGISRLPARIFELKAAGFSVRKESLKGVDGRVYTHYRMPRRKLLCA